MVRQLVLFQRHNLSTMIDPLEDTLPTVIEANILGGIRGSAIGTTIITGTIGDGIGIRGGGTSGAVTIIRGATGILGGGTGTHDPARARKPECRVGESVRPGRPCSEFWARG
jgi:hypothetical protein